MLHIAIISSSIRLQRKSHRAALYFKNYLEETNEAIPFMLDLKEYNFPLFDNTLKEQQLPAANLLHFAENIKLCDGVIMVTPEYNGSFPASLKNVIDVLYDEWKHKPVGIVTVSAGPFGGAQALAALQFTLWKMKVWTIPAMFSVPNVQEAYNEDGKPDDKIASDKLAAVFIKELLWCAAQNKNKYAVL